MDLISVIVEFAKIFTEPCGKGNDSLFMFSIFGEYGNRDYKEIYKVWNDAKRKSLIMENAKFGTDWHKGYASEYSYFMTNLKLKVC